MSLPRFFLTVLALLVPCYLFWYLLHPWIGNPLAWVLDVHLTAMMPGLVEQVGGDGVNVLIYSTYSEVNGELTRLQGSEYRVGFPFNSRILTYALPFYAALTLATPGPERLDTLFRGFLVLLPTIYLCALGVALQAMSAGLGDRFELFGGNDIIRRSLVALYYQLSTLILPVLAPVLVWAWQSRDSTLFVAFVRPPRSDRGVPEAGKQV